jgi:hypothetical protein
MGHIIGVNIMLKYHIKTQAHTSVFYSFCFHKSCSHYGIWSSISMFKESQLNFKLRLKVYSRALFNANSLKICILIYNIQPLIIFILSHFGIHHLFLKQHNKLWYVKHSQQWVTRIPSSGMWFRVGSSILQQLDHSIFTATPQKRVHPTHYFLSSKLHFAISQKTKILKRD